MTNDEPDVLVQRFIDGDLSDAEVEAALHRIADDEGARDLLQFELRMTQDLAATRSAQPPPDFAPRTMEAVAHDESVAGTQRVSIGDRLQAWWETLTRPVTLQVRPVAAVVSVLMAGIVAWTVWSAGPAGVRTGGEGTVSTDAATVQQATAQTDRAGETVWVRFLYPNSDADSVAVAGDFSQWEPVSLSRRTVGGETVWTGLVPVSPGEHEYQFLINGDRWVPDPLAPVKRSDGFGARNAVLNV